VVRLPGLVPNDIAVALGVIANTFTERAADLGARAVHFDDLAGATPSYSVSQQSSSIDSCAVRFCSYGHRCSGTYTPRATASSLEPEVVSLETARQMSPGSDEGGT
jgi:hypothetical protein